MGLNKGMAFSPEILDKVLENTVEVAQRVETLKKKSANQNVSPSDILKLISFLDLTSLAGNDTPQKIDIMLKKAVKPLANADVKVASVCVYQNFVKQSVHFLAGAEVGVATVSGGFPGGQMDLEVKLKDIEKSVELGATEIDAVINRTNPLTGNWEALYQEVAAFKASCGNAKLKVIMATGELEDYTIIAKTSWVCMMAGADFIKTSTGMESVNATLEAGYIMMKAIRGYNELTGIKVGLKPAGGIRTTETAAQWLLLLREELGEAWADKSLFRIGASGLLNDLIKAN